MKQAYCKGCLHNVYRLDMFFCWRLNRAKVKERVIGGKKIKTLTCFVHKRERGKE